MYVMNNTKGYMLKLSLSTHVLINYLRDNINNSLYILLKIF